MKCPVCWAEKAYVRKVEGLRGLLHHLALLVPMKCHHCYHKFTVSWFATIGQTIHPPKIRRTHATPHPSRGSHESRRNGSAAQSTHWRPSRKPSSSSHTV